MHTNFSRLQVRGRIVPDYIWSYFCLLLRWLWPVYDLQHLRLHVHSLLWSSYSVWQASGLESSVHQRSLHRCLPNYWVLFWYDNWVYGRHESDFARVKSVTHLATQWNAWRASHSIVRDHQQGGTVSFLQQDCSQAHFNLPAHTWRNQRPRSCTESLARNFDNKWLLSDQNARLVRAKSIYKILSHWSSSNLPPTNHHSSTWRAKSRKLCLQTQMSRQQRRWGWALYWEVLPNKSQEHWILTEVFNCYLFLWPNQLDWRDIAELKAAGVRKEELKAVTESDDDVTWIQGAPLLNAHDPSETSVGHDR